MGETIDAETPMKFDIGTKVSNSLGRMSLLIDRIIQIMYTKALNVLLKFLFGVYLVNRTY